VLSCLLSSFNVGSPAVGWRATAPHGCLIGFVAYSLLPNAACICSIPGSFLFVHCLSARNRSDAFCAISMCDSMVARVACTRRGNEALPELGPRRNSDRLGFSPLARAGPVRAHHWRKAEGPVPVVLCGHCQSSHARVHHRIHSPRNPSETPRSRPQDGWETPAGTRTAATDTIRVAHVTAPCPRRRHGGHGPGYGPLESARSGSCGKTGIPHGPRAVAGRRAGWTRRPAGPRGEWCGGGSAAPAPAAEAERGRRCHCRVCMSPERPKDTVAFPRLCAPAAAPRRWGGRGRGLAQSRACGNRARPGMCPRPAIRVPGSRGPPCEARPPRPGGPPPVLRHGISGAPTDLPSAKPRSRAAGGAGSSLPAPDRCSAAARRLPAAPRPIRAGRGGPARPGGSGPRLRPLPPCRRAVGHRVLDGREEVGVREGCGRAGGGGGREGQMLGDREKGWMAAGIDLGREGSVQRR
jgi:hypothetical protein